MPAYTRPKTWKDATVLPHFDLNTYFRDGLLSAYGQPAVRAHRGSEIELSAANWTTIPMPFERFDASNMHTKQEGDRIVIKVDGVYLCGGAVEFEKIGGNGTRYSRILVNDDFAIAHIGPFNANSGERCGMTPVGLWYFRAGDYFQLQVWENDADTLVTKGIPPNSPEVWAVRLGDRTPTPTWTSPRTWIAETATHTHLNETATNINHLQNKNAAMIWGTATAEVDENTLGYNLQFLDGQWTEPTFDSEIFDTASMHSVTSNTGRLTIPTTGYYLVGGLVEFNTSTAGQRRVRLLKNGTTDAFEIVKLGPIISSTAVARSRLPVVYLEQFNAGDYLIIQGRTDGVNRNTISSYGYAPCLWAVEVAAEFTATTWTDPSSWTSRQAATSLHTELNAVRDNLKFLKGPPCAKLTTLGRNIVTNAGWVKVSMDGAVDFDTDSMLDNPNDRLTFNKKGKYLILAYGTFSNDANGQRGMRFKHVRNGVTQYLCTQAGIPGHGTFDSSVWIATLFEFAVGDYVELEARHGSSNTVIFRSGGELMAVWVSG